MSVFSDLFRGFGGGGGGGGDDDDDDDSSSLSLMGSLLDARVRDVARREAQEQVAGYEDTVRRIAQAERDYEREKARRNIDSDDEADVPDWYHGELHWYHMELGKPVRAELLENALQSMTRELYAELVERDGERFASRFLPRGWEAENLPARKSLEDYYTNDIHEQIKRERTHTVVSDEPASDWYAGDTRQRVASQRYRGVRAEVDGWRHSDRALIQLSMQLNDDEVDDLMGNDRDPE